jgi:hypothetical protein
MSIEPIWDLLEQPIEINIHFYCNAPNQRRLVTFATPTENSRPSAAFGLLCGDRLTINFDFGETRSTAAESAGFARSITPFHGPQSQPIVPLVES